MKDPMEPLRERCAATGFDLDRADPSLVDRMRLLARDSKTFDDANRMSSYADRIFRHYEEVKPDAAFDSVERRTVVLGCLFSDIGKTGPADADAEGRRLVAEIFAVENVRDDRQPLTTFFRTYFPDDAERRIAKVTSLGIDPSMPVRQFWNLHSAWTLAIAEASGLPPEAVAAAASHHLLEDVNPEAIVAEDGRFRRSFGDNERFGRAEKLVIVLDKYDAARRRGGLDHAGAIRWIRERIAKSARFRDDAELATLVADVETVLAS